MGNKKSYNLTHNPYGKLKEGPEAITIGNKENELLKANNADRKKLIAEILTAIHDQEIISGGMLETWGQTEYGIEHRTGPKG